MLPIAPSASGAESLKTVELGRGLVLRGVGQHQCFKCVDACVISCFHFFAFRASNRPVCLCEPSAVHWLHWRTFLLLFLCTSNN